MIDTKKVTDVRMAKVKTSDFPDFCDAFIESATYDGREMTEDELNELNENAEFVNMMAHDSLF